MPIQYQLSPFVQLAPAVVQALLADIRRSSASTEPSDEPTATESQMVCEAECYTAGTNVSLPMVYQYPSGLQTAKMVHSAGSLPSLDIPWESRCKWNSRPKVG